MRLTLSSRRRTLSLTAFFAAVFAVGVCFTATTVPARAQNDQAAITSAVATIQKFTPGMTRVAILPVIDKSGEKDDQRRDQANAVKMEAYDQFFQRGFKMVDEATVAKAVADSGINFDDEEEHRKDNMYKIGKALDVDLVMFVVVDQSYAKVKHNIFSDQREGLAKTKTWLLDARGEKPLLSAYIREGKSTGNVGIASKGNRSRMGSACSNAIRDTLNDVLKPFNRDKDKKWPGNSEKAQ